jgi:SAM-dependent methyltransferase
VAGDPRESVLAQAERVGKDWLGSPYYASAEQWTFIFWRRTGLFRQMFDLLDLTHVVELACGYGRHAEMFRDRAERITLLDILEENIEQSRKRHAAHRNITCLRNNGIDYAPLAERSATAVFCYDAMVHFTPEVVGSYVLDTARVLTPGGRALFHHSNYGVPTGHGYGANPHARNYMTQELFSSYAREARLEVERSHVIPWGEIADLDCITLLRKPAG